MELGAIIALSIVGVIVAVAIVCGVALFVHFSKQDRNASYRYDRE